MKITMKHITCLLLAATTFVFVGCTTPTRYGRSTGQYIDDQTVTRNVKRELGRDSLTDGAPIKVETFRGNVHLTGFVQHPIQKEQAGRIVSRVDGVQYFKNDIIVQNELPTVRAMGEQSMREPAGAQNSRMRSDFQGSQGSEGWQRGRYNAFGPRDEFQEPAGAETNVDVQRNDGTEHRKTEIETETKVERD